MESDVGAVLDWKPIFWWELEEQDWILRKTSNPWSKAWFGRGSAAHISFWSSYVVDNSAAYIRTLDDTHRTLMWTNICLGFKDLSVPTCGFWHAPRLIVTIDLLLQRSLMSQHHAWFITVKDHSYCIKLVKVNLPPREGRLLWQEYHNFTNLWLSLWFPLSWSDNLHEQKAIHWLSKHPKTVSWRQFLTEKFEHSL